MRRLRWLALAATVLLAAGCAGLPPMAARSDSSAFTDTAATTIGEAIAPLLAADPERSGIHALPDAFDAVAVRAVVAAAAQRSIDAQCFIWHDDQVGMLLFQALWRGAERGLRVRLLIDDGGTSGIDRTLAQLDAHPHIELRLYNPFAWRGSRALGYLSDFTRLNRRLHNKSFTVDNLASVVGGRNIANENFGAAGAIGVADLDVLAIGPVVHQVSAQFDRYWNGASAYPAAQILAPPPADAAQPLQAAFASARADPVLRHRQPLFRARRRGHRLAGRSGAQWRAGAGADQLAGLVRRKRGACRPHEAPRRLAACRRQAVRTEARRQPAVAAGARPLRRRQGGRAACQDLCRRRRAHLRRLVRFRPALGAAEHRTGRGARQPGGRGRAGAAVRAGSAAAGL